MMQLLLSNKAGCQTFHEQKAIYVFQIGPTVIAGGLFQTNLQNVSANCICIFHMKKLLQN